MGSITFGSLVGIAIGLVIHLTYRLIFKETLNTDHQLVFNDKGECTIQQVATIFSNNNTTRGMTVRKKWDYPDIYGTAWFSSVELAAAEYKRYFPDANVKVVQKLRIEEKPSVACRAKHKFYNWLKEEC